MSGIGAPFLLLLACSASSPRQLQVLLGLDSGGRWLRLAVILLAAGAQLGRLAFLCSKLPFIENRHASIHADKAWPDGDRGEFFNWMTRHVPKEEIVLAAMTLSAELRLATPLKLAIHPQFEAQHLRDRVQELYQFYQCTPPASFAKTMKKYRSRYLVLEFKRCSFGPFLLDKYPEVNCKEGDRPWQDLFCPRALASPLFELQWANAEFAVLRLRGKEEVPREAKAGSVADLHTWEPMLKRCLEEEPEHCAARAADLALAFRKMGQPKVTQTLLKWAEQHGSKDAAFQYIMGYHLDYNLDQSQRAGQYYQRASELEPNNPVFVKEYLMWLELIAKDNRTLVRFLGPRRFSSEGLASLGALGCPALACEASVTARELFQDLDWSQELWSLALERGICNPCVGNNWALHAEGQSMRQDLGDWELLVSAFWRRSMRSSMLGVAGNAGRYGHQARRVNRTWSLKPIFALSKGSSINELLQPGDVVKRLQVVNLGDTFASAQAPNTLKFPGEMVLTEHSWSTQTLMRHNRRDDRGHAYVQLLRSGPRKTLHFDPASSSAVIVTCGGLCPGLNSVIREIVMTLTSYGVQHIYGCKGGYKGMVKPDDWVTLTPAVVQDIHNKGGTILVSDRGNPPHMDIAKTLKERNIRQYFVIGGDGTQMGAFETFTATQEIQHEVAVVGVPKTIDNDIPVLDRSFGFNTACSEAERAIDSAYTERLPYFSTEHGQRHYENTLPEYLEKMRGNMCWIQEWYEEPGLAELWQLPLEAQLADGASNVRKEEVLVFEDQGRLCRDALECSGVRATFVSDSDFPDQEGFKALLSKRWDLVVFGFGLDLLAQAEVTEELWARTEALSRWYLELARALQRSPCGRLAVLTRDAFFPKRRASLAAGCLWAMGNCIRLELADLPLQYIDVSGTEGLAPSLAAELFSQAFGSSTLRLAGVGASVGRFVLRQVPSEQYQLRHRFEPPASGEILITGGNGSLAQVFALHLLQQAERWNRENFDLPVCSFRLLMLSRSGSVRERELEAWRRVQSYAKSLKIQVEQRRCDVGCAQEVEDLVASLSPRIVGVVHTAGVLQDALLPGQSWEKMAATLGCKAKAALYLHDSLERHKSNQLNFFWAFSSSSVSGNMGQVNYAGANHFLDGLMRHRHALGRPGVAMQWGAWGEAGMAANMSAPMRAAIMSSHLPFFSNEEGFRGMHEGISCKLPSFAVFKHNPEVLVQMATSGATAAERYARNFASEFCPVPPPAKAAVAQEFWYDLWRMARQRKIACGSLWIAGLLQLCEEKEEDELQGRSRPFSAPRESDEVEATCNAHCIGLVKLMGRLAPARSSADMCLLPEMDISLPRVLSHAMHLLKTKGHAVIVVAEGCGDTLLKSSGERDAGGNKKLADVGPWLKEQLLSYAKRRSGKGRAFRRF
ncbi:unnamed protein product [Effrenium voratum]|uniref:Ketoreductase domain-containing protein n=2 Tax=Effrenium voratum TaxID=2562239 RepID=A0AA36ICP8_9DINO|nr:unnamed protein product [Effrenium voratum]